MKILIIIKWFVRYNGAARVAYELAKRFSKLHDVYIASYADYIEKDWEREFEIYKIKCKGMFSINELNELQRIIKPDVIHSHDWIGLLFKFSGVPQVATNHSNWPKNWFISFKHFASGFLQEIPHYIKLKSVNEVVCVSKYQQEVYRKIGINSVVIYNGIDERFLTKPENDIDLKRPCTLFVGRIDKRKAKHLIPIIKSINKKMDAHHYIIGYPADTILIKKLKNIENVQYLGVVDDIRPYYRNADVLMFTSRLEAFPLTPLEAMACGLPVVAFDVCSHREIIKHRETGFLANAGNINEFTNFVLTILNDEELKKRMGVRAIKTVKKKFLWDDKVEKYLQLFERVTLL